MDFSEINPSISIFAIVAIVILILIATLILCSPKKPTTKTSKPPAKPIEAQQPKKTTGKKKSDKAKQKTKKGKKLNQEQKIEEKEEPELENKSDEKEQSVVEPEEEEEEEEEQVEGDVESSDDELFPELSSNRKKTKNETKQVSVKKKTEKNEKQAFRQEEPMQTLNETQFNQSEWEEVNKRGNKRRQKLDAADEQMVVINTTSSAENTVVEIEIGLEPIKVVIGNRGSTIQQIESSTGAKIKVNKDKGFVTISGNSEQAEAAKVAISDIVTQFTENARLIETATVDVGKSGSAVIGKGGSTLKKIESQSGAKLNLSKESSILSITGTKEQIEKAKVLINNAIYGEASIPIGLGEKGLATLLKKNGELIKSVTNLYQNVRIDLKKEENICLVYGSAEHVAEAAQMVTRIINEHSYRKTILVGASLGMVLGKGGENIKNIQSSTDVIIDIAKDEATQNHRIHLTGQKERVIRAHDMIENILASPFNPTCAPGETFIHIEVGEAIGQVIGTKGAKITEIETASGAKLNVPNGTSLCVVQGTNEQIQAAKAIIDDIVKRYEEANAPVNVDSFQSSMSALKSKKKIIDYENDWGGTCAAYGW